MSKGQSGVGEYQKWTVWGLSYIFGPAYIHMNFAQTMVCVLYITNHKWHHPLFFNEMMLLVRVHTSKKKILVIAASQDLL